MQTNVGLWLFVAWDSCLCPSKASQMLNYRPLVPICGRAISSSVVSSMIALSKLVLIVAFVLLSREDGYNYCRYNCAEFSM